MSGEGGINDLRNKVTAIEAAGTPAAAVAAHVALADPHVQYALESSLGTLATQNGTFSGTSSGTNTGDQSSIVGITGTLLQFNTALTDADFATGGGTATGSNTGDQTTITGNAGSATVLQTARNFSITGAGITAAAVSFNGSAVVTLAASVDAGHITLARMANLAANSIIGNNTGVGAVPLALTAAQVRTLINVADGATANAGTVTSVSGTGTVSGITLTGTVSTTGSLTLGGTFSTTSTAISDFNSATRAQVEAELVAGANITITPAGTGATRTLTIAGAAGGGGVSDGDKGDITVTATGATWTIDAAVVSNAKLANVATATFKGRVTAATGDPEDLTGTQATTLLDPFTPALKGLAPASGGGTANFLRADGTWATPAGGGGAPAGNTGEVQFNNAGAFAGAANVEIDAGNLKLVSTTDPTGVAGSLILYSKNIAGRHLPKIVGPTGIDTILQVGLSGNRVFLVAPASGTTAPTVIGGTLTTAATMSLQQTFASANPWQATSRKRFASAATAGSITGMRTAYTQWFRGSAAGFGGFFFRAQLGQNLNVTGGQCFVGLCVSTAALAATAGAVSALLNTIGMGYDTTDANTGNWFIVRNDGTGTATKVDLGVNAARNTTHGYDLVIFCPAGAATEIFVRVVNVHSNIVVLDTSFTADLPTVNTGLAFKSEINNGAVASAVNLEIAKVYIESDY